MAHFYGAIQGQAGEATRMGSKDSGIDAYVQSYYSRVAVSLMHRRGEDDNDIAHITIEGGPSTSYGRRTLSFNPNAVAEALDTRDPRIMRIWARIEAEFGKLDVEAPKAIARVEKARKKEQRRQERERKEHDHFQGELRAGLSKEERRNLCMVLAISPDVNSESNVEMALSQHELYAMSDKSIIVMAKPKTAWRSYAFDVTAGQWVLHDDAAELGLDDEALRGFGYRVDDKFTDRMVEAMS